MKKSKFYTSLAVGAVVVGLSSIVTKDIKPTPYQANPNFSNSLLNEPVARQIPKVNNIAPVVNYLLSQTTMLPDLDKSSTVIGGNIEKNGSTFSYSYTSDGFIITLSKPKSYHYLATFLNGLGPVCTNIDQTITSDLCTDFIFQHMDYSNSMESYIGLMGGPDSKSKGVGFLYKANTLFGSFSFAEKKVLYNYGNGPRMPSLEVRATSWRTANITDSTLNRLTEEFNAKLEEFRKISVRTLSK